jgi:hypothetical protein
MPSLHITTENAVAVRNNDLPPHMGGAVHRVNGTSARRSIVAAQANLHEVAEYFPLIPEAEFPNAIRAMAGHTLHDLAGPVLPPHDQGSTPLCWAHGSTRALEILRVYEAQAAQLLSAEAVAYLATGGSMRGGSSDEALAILVQHGAPPDTDTGRNTFSTGNWNASWKDDALDYCVVGWLDVRTWQEQITLALNAVPIAITLEWWGHLVCQVDAGLDDAGKPIIGFDNSWGKLFGVNGYATLDRQHGESSGGAFAPISATWKRR